MGYLTDKGEHTAHCIHCHEEKWQQEYDSKQDVVPV